MGLLKEFSKAQVSSLVSTGCDFVTTAAVFQMIHHVVASTASGAIVGGIVNCVINYVWTFRGSHRSKRSVMFRYLLVWTGSVLLNTAGTEWGVKAIQYASAWLGGGWQQNLSMVLVTKAVVAVMVAVFWNFTMQKYYVYRTPQGYAEKGNV